MEIALATMAQETSREGTQPLVEGRDYYFESGRSVLTEGYLRRRGSCCDNGCRHCPYRGADD
jgi:hypothetical protein